MTIIIKDGVGTGNQAQVDTTNRLRTRTVSATESEEAAKEGNAFNLNTGVITLTSANESAVMYVKNNDSDTFHIESIALGIDNATGITAGDQFKITIVRNPTVGTIVSDAVDVDINVNRNFGSVDTITSDVYKGGEGKTLTDGIDALLLYQGDSGRLFAGITLMLPKGTSIGIKIDPPAGNTSVDCYVALIGHLENGSE
jgi:stress response protein SCP2